PFGEATVIDQRLPVRGKQRNRVTPCSQGRDHQRTKFPDSRTLLIRGKPRNVHDSSFSIVFGHVTSNESQRRRAARPIFALRSASEQSRSIASAMLFGSGEATQPVSPLRTSWRTPPESVSVMTGLDADAASIVTYATESSSTGR